jgi:hypothetical protein
MDGDAGYGIKSDFVYVQCNPSHPSLPSKMSPSVHELSSDDESLPPYVIPIRFKTGYSAYESAPRDVPFSEEYIKELSVRQCTSPNFGIPPALPVGTVKLCGWSETEPTDSHFLLVNGAIPSLGDVRAFLGDQPSKFAGGYRSVLLQAHGEILDASKQAGLVDSPSFATHSIRNRLHRTFSRCAPLVQRRTVSRPRAESQVSHRHNSIEGLTRRRRIHGIPRLSYQYSLTGSTQALFLPVV